MSNLLLKIWKIVISRNVAIVLLIIITVLLGIGALLPNPELISPEERKDIMLKHPFIYWLGERYNSQKLAGGYVFGFLGAFLIVSTTLCSIDRFIKLYQTRGSFSFIPPRAGHAKGMKHLKKGGDITVIENFSRKWLRKKRCGVAVRYDNGKTSIAGIRGRIGFWGSVLFHVILITALFGLVAYYLGAYRARLSFTEGQSYPLHKDRFTYIEKRPIWGMKLPEVEKGLVKQYSN